MPLPLLELLMSVSSISPLSVPLPLLLAMLAFLTVLIAVLGFNSVLGNRMAQQEVRRRAEGRWESDTTAGVMETAEPISQGVFRVLTVLGRSVTPSQDAKLSQVRRALIKAGYRNADGPIVFFGFKCLLAIFLPLLYALLRPPALQVLPATQTMLLFVTLALLGFYAPNVWVHSRMRRRQRQIVTGFPDALDLMVVCVEAGLGLDAALHRVGEEVKLGHKALGEELGLFNLELQAGQPRQNALRNLSLRIDLEEVKSFVAMLIQTEKFGTSIAQALRVHADTMRTRRRQKAEELANKIPVKLLFPLIFFILPSLFVAIIGPGIIQIFRVLIPILTRG